MPSHVCLLLLMAAVAVYANLIPNQSTEICRYFSQWPRIKPILHPASVAGHQIHAVHTVCGGVWRVMRKWCYDCCVVAVLLAVLIWLCVVFFFFFAVLACGVVLSNQVMITGVLDMLWVLCVYYSIVHKCVRACVPACTRACLCAYACACIRCEEQACPCDRNIVSDARLLLVLFFCFSFDLLPLFFLSVCLSFFVHVSSQMILLIGHKTL